MIRIISKFFMILKILAMLFLMSPSISNAEDLMCKGLKKINNLDELLYQMYINLDSDCLFKIPVFELEEIWDFKIYSDERAVKLWKEKFLNIEPSGKDYDYLYFKRDIRNGEDFRNKPYRTERDLFYISKSMSESGMGRFTIGITSDAYKKFGTLFPDGRFPKLLPVPQEVIAQAIQVASDRPDSSGENINSDLNAVSDFLSSRIYFWRPSDDFETGSMLKISTERKVQIEHIFLYNHNTLKSMVIKPAK